MNLTPESVKLYEIIVNEHHSYVRVHESRLTFWYGVLAGLIGATGVGWWNAKVPHHYIALCLGPAMILAVVPNALQSALSSFRLALHAIATRARLEYEMGLTETCNTRAIESGRWVAGEPIKSLKDQQDWHTCRTGADFVGWRSDKFFEELSGWRRLGIIFVIVVLYFKGFFVKQTVSPGLALQRFIRFLYGPGTNSGVPLPSAKLGYAGKLILLFSLVRLASIVMLFWFLTKVLGWA